ncbi:MAG: efflux RND transporter permease subunit [Betaproteobacteria bacterium]|nr:efflux RND transporter permease subunit [Betaproteobacteria bacterium]
MKNFNLSEWALEHQALVLFFMLALFAAGLFSYFRLGQAEDPEFTFKVMVIRAIWPGASPAEMEQQVTERLEKKLQETPYLDNVRSFTKSGEATIFVTLKDSTPPKEVAGVWYQVRKKIGDIRFTLPVGTLGPFFNDEFGDVFGNIYAFTGDGYTYAELNDYVEDVRKEILRVPAVAKAEVVGDQDQKIYVEMSHRKLATLGIDPLSIFNVLREQNAMTPAGSIDTHSDRIFLRISGSFDSVESIREIGIQANGRLFRLGDIAHVYRGYVDPPSQKVRYMGQEAIALAVSMAKGGDILQLGQDLEKSFARIKRDLPVGIEVHQYSNQPEVVKRSVDEFMRTLLEAVVIVLAVSFFSLGFRTGLVVALSIPLVLAVTFLMMKLYGIDLQRISLGALIISLGLLVDDAIISVEMMATKMEQGMERAKAAGFAYTSTAFPMLTGTLITAAAFTPVGFAKSSAGEYTFSIFAVVTIALMVSWVVAVLFTPYLGYKLLPDLTHHAPPPSLFQRFLHAPLHRWIPRLIPAPTAPHHGDVYDSPFYRRFRGLVDWCVNYRKTVILITVAVFALSIFGFRFVQNQFFPSSNRPELIVDLWLPQGASFQATELQVKRMEEKLKGDENVLNYVAYVGNGSPRFYLPLDQQLGHPNFAQFVIVTKNNKAREVLYDRINRILETEFTVLRGRVNRLENGPPVGYPVQFRVVGNDIPTVRRIAFEVASIVRANPNAQNVHLDWNEQVKNIRLEIDQNKARVIGVSSQGLSTVLNSILTGYSITQYREKDKLIEVLARAETGERLDPGKLSEINVPTQSGKWIPLAQIAKIEYGFEEGIIWRRNRQPSVTVRADTRGDVQAPVISKQIDPQLDALRAKLPEYYRIEMAGAIEESAKGENSIIAVMPLMLITVLTLLMIQLQSFQKTIMVLLTSPLGLIGVAFILLTWNVPFGFVANLGVIALFGMIMRNSVILVDQIEQDIKAGHPQWNAIVDATVRRFRPIVLTALAAVLAMIPLSRSNFWGPMAVAIMGGLISATILTLLFVPALYAAWFRVKKPAPDLPGDTA